VTLAAPMLIENVDVLNARKRMCVALLNGKKLAG
jgi:hypothetical protein